MSSKTNGVVVCDASAVIAFLRGEEGADTVRLTLEHADGPSATAAWISTVNLCEVHQEAGQVLPEIIGPEGIISPVDFSAAQASEAAAMREPTRGAGLGIADRACLALAKTLDLPVLTADRIWADVALEVAVDVQVIR